MFSLYKSAITYNFFFFFFNDTATTEIYTLSLHDALPISAFSRRSRCRSETPGGCRWPARSRCWCAAVRTSTRRVRPTRSEEHTSELQSRLHLVCRLLLEKKKIKNTQMQFQNTMHRYDIYD